MDVEIKEFSLTILVGVAFVVSAILSIRLTVWPGFRIKLPHLFKIDSADGSGKDKAEEILTFAHNIALVVVFLGLGLLIQDYSKSVVAQRSSPVLAEIWGVDSFVRFAFPSAEMTSRLEPFFAERAVDIKGSTWSPQRSIAGFCDQYFRTRRDEDNHRIPVAMELSEFAKHMVPILTETARPVTANIQDAGRELDSLLAYSEGKAGARQSDCKALMSVDLLYYRAKNRDFQNRVYFEELREIEGKLSFLRGMISVVAFTWLLYIGLLLVSGFLWIKRGRVARRRDVHRGALAARHGLWIGVLLVGGYFLQDAYRAEQLNFNNRVYGYFEVLCLIGDDCLKQTKSE